MFKSILQGNNVRGFLTELDSKLKNDINNVIFHKNSRNIYTFKDNTYQKFTITHTNNNTTIRPDSGYPKNTTLGWGNIPASFDSCGYVHFNSVDILMFTKDRQYWLFDESANKIFDGYPRDFSKFELFKNKPEFNQIQNLDAIFIWQYAGVSYNCFVSGHKIYMIKKNDPSKLQSHNFKTMFPDLPNFVKSISVVPNTDLIIIFADYQWYIYNQMTRKTVSKKENQMGDTNKEENTSGQINKMQEWCRQLYEQEIYTKDDYNKCVRDSRMMGVSVETAEKIMNAKHEKGSIAHDYALYNDSLIGGKKKTSFKETEPVYIISNSGLYLKSSETNTLTMTKTLEKPVETYEWYIQKLGNDEYGIKDYKQNYLQGDKGKVSVPNKFIGLMSKWNLVHIGTAYSLYHKDTGKSLKTDPLGLDFYSPDDSMIWNIISQEQDDVFQRYDPTEMKNQKNSIIESYREAYRKAIISIQAKNMEEQYTRSVMSKFDNLSQHVRSIVPQCAKNYYKIGPLPAERRGDTHYFNYHNQIHAWRDQIQIPTGPADNRQIYKKYKLNRSLFNIRGPNPYAPFNYGVTRVLNRNLFNSAQQVLNRYYNSTIRPDIDLQKRNYYRHRRTTHETPLRQRMMNTHHNLSNKRTELIKWKNNLVGLIRTAEQEKERLRRNTQFQLNNINKLKNERVDLDDKLDKSEGINLNNMDILLLKNNDEQREIYMYYSLISLSILWIFVLVYLTFKRNY